MTSIGDYNEIMSDRNKFNSIVYTPLSEALKILEKRQKDKVLVEKINFLLKDSLPNFIRDNKKCAILLRQVATPNHEIRSFISIANDNGLYPVICEYHDDKFTSNNSYKHSLGQLRVQRKENDKNGNFLVEKFTIIDFNKNNGKKIKEVMTFWGEPLVCFHKKIFMDYFKNENFVLWDGSDWYNDKNLNRNVAEHYKNLFLFFVCNAILFENFLTEGTEGEFSKEILLPTIEEIIKLTGVAPLIVPIPPMDLENESFWYHQLSEVINNIPNK